MASVRRRSRGVIEPVIGLLVLSVIIGIMGYALYVWLTQRTPTPDPIRVQAAEQCVATADDDAQSMTLVQARNAGIIAAEGMRRGLAPRAVTIALATAMQESSLRNIDYGDRDSVGLFQQRPSQGWGTVEQIMDPWYSSGKFYEALVKVDNWQEGDINDIAQTVQRSGHPNAYRQWEPLARAWASVLTGHSPEGISCVRHDTENIEVALLDEVLRKAQPSVAATRTADHLTLEGEDATALWSAISLAMTQNEKVRIVRVQIDGRQWSRDDYSVPGWHDLTDSPSSGPKSGKTTAVVTFG